MKNVMAPGYEILYGKPTMTYEETMKDIPSEMAVFILTMLNNELNAHLPDKVLQSKLRAIATSRFTISQKKLFNEALYRFIDRQHDNDKDKVVTFGRRYLIAMMQKELTRNVRIECESISPEQEFNFFMGYLKIIDELDVRDRALFDEIMKHPDDKLATYRQLWTLNIIQYEFNDRVNAIFDLLKLTCFSKFALENYRIYWAEYLNSLGFNNTSKFLGSFLQIAQVALQHNSDEIFSKLNVIQPLPDKSDIHLKALSVNHLMGTKNIELQDLKKYPLFYRNYNNTYTMVDESFYAKKMYKGPFFELRKDTNLSKILEYNSYSSIISKKVLEEILFQRIMNLLRPSIKDVIHFDSEEDSMPDCYCRTNRTIFLIEYKAYIVPDDLSTKPNFDEIKRYIDSRFIKNKNGKSKGIKQLANQLELLVKDHYTFDPKCNKYLKSKKFTIYPIICHNEIYFSMPGINEYLNEKFFESVGEELKSKLIIKNVTLINLEVLCDMALRSENLNKLQLFIDRYWEIIANRKKKYNKEKSIDNLLYYETSFDELFGSMFQRDLKNMKTGPDLLKNFTHIVHLSDEELETVL